MALDTIQRIRSIFNSDKGGSYANEFEVQISFNPTSNKGLIDDLRTAGFNVNASEGAVKNMFLLCDEASLPGQFSATNEIDGLYTGRLIQYPQAKLYNDFSLSFIQTNKLNPSKFFDIWMYYMFPEYDLNSGDELSYFDRNKRSQRTNITSVNYYDRCICDFIEVKKMYKNSSAPNGGVSATYKMFKAYPYTIETIPLSYGPSVLNKLRVQFRYEKHVSFF